LENNIMSDLKTNRGSKECPVHFNHETQEHAHHWPEEFRELREQCPRAWSDEHGGFWVATRLADIIAVAQRSDVFSTHKEFDPVTGAVLRGGVSLPPVPGVRGIPNESDSPEWELIRGFVNRRFAPRAAESRRAKAQYLVAALVDEVIETGRFDIVEDLTNPLPALVAMDLFGFRLDEWRSFADPFHKMMYLPNGDPAMLGVIKEIDHFHRRVDEEIALRHVEPRDDLLGYLATGTADGGPLDYERLHNLAFNLMVGGIDTTTALTSNALLHLARNPDQRQRLIEQPELLPVACEEFVRFFSPIHGNARNATRDVEVNGWHIEKGDRVLLAYSAGNRDPEAFDSPDEVRLNRFPNRHVGFGAGMHRCLGSFLARMMFSVMVTEVLNRMPDYKVIEPELVKYPSVAKANGWIRIPATFTPGPKVGAKLE
jgi:cytochrome P450